MAHDLTTRAVWRHFPSLEMLAKRPDLGKTTALKVGRALVRLRPEITALSETHDRIVREHAERNPDGSFMQTGTGLRLKNVVAYAAAWEDVLANADPIALPLPKLAEADLPDSLSALEVEALLELGMIEDASEES